MSKNASVLVMANILMLTGMTFGQEPTGGSGGKADVGTTNVSGLLQSVNVHDVLEIATELRKASESMKSFGESLKVVSTVAAEAAGSTSQNLAAIGGEFDPFGFKTAFKTIQQQNAIIQAQNKIIMELQQKEIRRLEQEIKTAKRPKRNSRRRKPSRPKESRLID